MALPGLHANGPNTSSNDGTEPQQSAASSTPTPMPANDQRIQDSNADDEQDDALEVIVTRFESATENGYTIETIHDDKDENIDENGELSNDIAQLMIDPYAEYTTTKTPSFDPQHYSTTAFPATAIGHIEKFQITEPYLFRHAPQCYNRWNLNLRRQTVQFLIVYDADQDRNRLVRGGRVWEMLEETGKPSLEWLKSMSKEEKEMLDPINHIANEAPPFNERVERLTRQEIIRKTEKAIDTEIERIESSCGVEVLTPEVLFRLQRTMIWSKTDIKADSWAEMYEEDRDKDKLRTIDQEFTLLKRYTKKQPVSRKKRMPPIGDLIDRLDDVEVKNGTKYMMATRVEACRKYRSAEWEGDSVWRRLL